MRGNQLAKIEGLSLKCRSRVPLRLGARSSVGPRGSHFNSRSISHRFMSQLILVRHGQAAFLSDDYDRLSPIGEIQARRLGDFWRTRGITFDRIFTGPRVRQINTAKYVG